MVIASWIEEALSRKSAIATYTTLLTSYHCFEEKWYFLQNSDFMYVINLFQKMDDKFSFCKNFTCL
jgi:hypothetical protein